MPRFIYTAKSQPNQIIQGEIEAESEQEIINRLTRMGYFPISIRTQEIILDKQGLLDFRRVSKKDTVLFTRQLARLIESGVNILNGLGIISGQTSNTYFKTIIDGVIGEIKDGKSLSASLSNYPDIFPNLYTSLIRSGEAGGKLETTLKSLADFLEKDEEFRNSIRAALIYPAFVLTVGILTIIVLLSFVIPRLVSMFEDMRQLLPLATRILMSVSGFLRSRGWLILAIMAVCLFLFKRLIRSPQGRILWDAFKLKVFVWGQIILKTEISRLMRTSSLLLSGGVPVIASLEISASIVENQVLKSTVQKLKEDISNGLSLSESIKNAKIFPPFVVHIVTIAEETGTLDKSLLRIAEDYEKDLERTLKNLARLLEPTIILAIGLIVGFIVLSMLLPIFQINLIVR